MLDFLEILIIYVFLGDKTNAYRARVAPYKSIWTSLILICLIALTVNFFAFDRLNQRVPGLSATTNLTRDSVLELAASNQRNLDGLNNFKRISRNPNHR